MLRPPPISPLFPYTTLFRSAFRGGVRAQPGRPAAAMSRPGVGDERPAPRLARHLPALQRAARRGRRPRARGAARSEEHTSELQSLAYLVCRLLLEKKKNNQV